MNNYNPNIHHRKSIRLRGYDYVFLHEHIVMPNHIHGIIELRKNPVGVQNFEPRRNEYQKIIPHSIGSIVRGFKIGVTKCSDVKSIHEIIN